MLLNKMSIATEEKKMPLKIYRKRLRLLMFEHLGRKAVPVVAPVSPDYSGN